MKCACTLCWEAPEKFSESAELSCACPIFRCEKFAEPTRYVIETLAEPSDPEDRYEKTVAMLDGQFKVAKNTPFERHVFRQMVPQLNEPVDKFVARLRQQA